MHVRLTKEQKIKIANGKDLYKVMREILLRENKLGRAREHFWVVALATNGYILAIELVALGRLNGVNIQPADVFKLAFAKDAYCIIMVHNHPSGELKPSESDKDLTDKMQQLGKFHSCPVADHLIISEEGFYSFKESGVLAKLDLYTKYPLDYIRKVEELEEAKRKAVKDRDVEIAKRMKLAGVEEKIIAITTGLSESEIRKLK